MASKIDSFTENKSMHEHHHHHHDDAPAEEVTLLIEGMTCNNCSYGITKHLLSKGIQNVETNFSTSEVNFRKPSDKSIEEVVAFIEELGYKVLNEKTKVKKTSWLNIDRKFYLSLIFTLPLVAHMFINWAFLHDPFVQLFLCLPVYLIGILHFGKSAWGSLKAKVANMDVLIFIGSSAAFVYSLAGTFLSTGSEEIANYLFYETAASIITLVLLGNLLEQRSVKKTTSAIQELTHLQKVKAQKLSTSNGIETYSEIDFEEIKIDDILKINSGDKIPVDAIVTQGTGIVDESMITGESLPIGKSLTDSVIGGTILTEGNLMVKAIKVGKDTVLSKIIELVKKAQQERPEIQKLGDRVSAIFVPIVLVISVLTFAYWYFIGGEILSKSLMISISVLVISCPCAMGLATPTAVMVGIGRAAKNGILIKGGSTIELLAAVRSIFFDKTGTLTTGNFSIQKIALYGHSKEEEIKNILYSLELHSSHPIAKSIIKELKDISVPIKLENLKEIKGIGIEGLDADGNNYAASSLLGLRDKTNLVHTIYLTKNKTLIAGIDLKDDIKPNTENLITQLNSKNIRTILLSGDTQLKCEFVAKQVGIKEVYGEQTPDQKLNKIEANHKSGITAMVGDGINDAPALSKADVGISISGATQVAIQSAQVVLLNKNDILQVNEALNIGKHTLITIKQNLFWAFFYNVIAIPIAAAGLLNPMIAAFIMAFSDVIVVGNSLRLKNKKLN